MIKLKRNVAPDQYLSDNRETNDKRNPSHTLSTMNNIFHGKVEVILNKNSCYFIQEKLFDIRFSYKHSNFSRVCLLVKMASKTVTRSILNLKHCHVCFLFKILWLSQKSKKSTPLFFALKSLSWFVILWISGIFLWKGNEMSSSGKKTEMQMQSVNISFDRVRWIKAAPPTNNGLV